MHESRQTADMRDKTTAAPRGVTFGRICSPEKPLHAKAQVVAARCVRRKKELVQFHEFRWIHRVAGATPRPNDAAISRKEFQKDRSRVVSRLECSATRGANLLETRFLFLPTAGGGGQHLFWTKIPAWVKRVTQVRHGA